MRRLCKSIQFRAAMLVFFISSMLFSGVFGVTFSHTVAQLKTQALENAAQNLEFFMSYLSTSLDNAVQAMYAYDTGDPALFGERSEAENYLKKYYFANIASEPILIENKELIAVGGKQWLYGIQLHADLYQKMALKNRLILSDPYYSQLRSYRSVGIIRSVVERESLSEIDLSATLCVEIEKNAFSGCTQLAKLQLPNTLKKIGNNAFGNAPIEEIILPDGLETIGESVFGSELRNVAVPSNVKELYPTSFTPYCVVSVSAKNNKKLGKVVLNNGNVINFSFPLIFEPYKGFGNVGNSQKNNMAEVRLDGNRAPGVRTQETNLGDFITDAFLWSAKQLLREEKIHAALTNGGGIRASIEKGTVTSETIKAVYPFGNEVVVFKVRQNGKGSH